MGAEQTTVAIGYVRVATGSQRQRESGVYLQRQAIVRYAQIHGVRIARFFSDHACVANIAERQGLSDAIAYIAKGKANALVVADLMRLTRSVEELLRYASDVTTWTTRTCDGVTEGAPAVAASAFR
jgi:DNA invertase Pin-like site-specific DNA recombinase